MNKITNIPYAFSRDTNDLKSIAEVANGKDCNCFCLTCGEDLVAKNKGNIKTPHFSHAVNSKCDSRETLLHFLTKHLFSTLTEIYIPRYESGWISYFKPQLIQFPAYLNTNGYIESDGYYSALGQKYPMKNVRIEKTLGNIIPDIMATVTIDGIEYEFLIEIAVTHFIDNEKKQFILNNNLNCIEIDLRDLYKSNNLWDKNSVNEKNLNPKLFNLINEVFIDHEKLMLDYEISHLIEGFITNKGQIYLLTEEFFKDKIKWQNIKTKFQHANI